MLLAINKIQFADDINLAKKMRNITTFNTDINKTLTDVINWVDINDLSINITKAKRITQTPYQLKFITILT